MQIAVYKISPVSTKSWILNNWFCCNEKILFVISVHSITTSVENSKNKINCTILKKTVSSN